MVTGGAGYIGSALVERLVEEGHKVVSIDNLSQGDYKYLVKCRESPRVKLVVGDICDSEKLEGVLREGEGVFRCSRMYEFCAEQLVTDS